MNHGWRSRGAGALIVLLTVVVYLPALRGGFIWDDDSYVTENQALRSLEGLGKIWTQPGTELQYYPLSYSGFWVQYHLWNLHPFGYHLINILLHAVNAVLLWGVLRRLAVPGSWWAAAIFALHPVQVESVAWITEFKNVTSVTFSLLTLLAFLRCRPLSASGTSATWDRRFYAVAILLFVCALLCKTAVCCLPVVLAVLLWWKLDRLTKRDILALIPWFAASLILGLITVRVESHLPEAGPTDWAVSMIHRGLLAGRALWFYAGKVFWPHPLTFIYPRWNIEVTTGRQYLFPLAAVAVVIALWWLRRRMGKGPLAGVVCFVAMLLPVLGFFNIYFFRFSYVTDHFQYLACSGLMALAVGAGATIADRTGRRGRHLAAVVGVGVLLLLAVSTWKQTHIYQDLETLWRDTLAKNPNAWIAHNNLGVILEPRGRSPEAIEHYEQALRIKSDYAEAHYNLGTLLGEAGRVPEAIDHLEQAVRIKPNYAEAHYNLGKALMVSGRVPEAVEHYEQALRLNPNNAEEHYSLGNLLLTLGKGQEAAEHWEQAIRIKPDYAEAYNNLGAALAQADRFPEAIEQFTQVVRITPGDAEAHFNLAAALEQADRVPEAIGHYEQALRLKPDFAEARERLARLQAGR